MADTANAVAFAISTPGADAAAAAFGRLAAGIKAANDGFDGATKSARNTGNAFDGAKQKVKQTDDAMKGMADGTRRVASTINVLTGAVQDANPALAGFVNAVGRSGTAISNMSALLGGGLGVVAGGLIAAFGLWTEHMKAASEEAKALADAQKTVNDELQKSIDLTHKAALSLVSNKSATQQARDTQIADLEAAIAARTSQRRGAFGQKAVDLGRQNQTDRLAVQRLREQGALESYRTGQAKALGGIDTDEEVADAEGNIHDLKTGGTKRPNYTNGGEYRNEFEAADRAQKQLDERSKFLDSAQRGGAGSKALAAEGHAGVLAADKSKADHEFDQKREEYAKNDKLAQEYAQKQELLDKKAQQRVAETRQLSTEAYAAVGSSGIQALQKLAKGQKVSTKEFVAGVGDQLVALGTKNLLEGTAELLFGNPAGAALAAVGGAEVAAGITMGAVTGGGSSGGGGAGSGGGSVGGGQRYWNGSKFAPISPTAPGARASTDPGGSLTVNFHSTFAPSADDGVRVTQSIAEAKRQGRL